ncbi:MAG: hypothetical protein WD873_00455 [Candidatus Hydrogenedentales bacterium]
MADMISAAGSPVIANQIRSGSVEEITDEAMILILDKHIERLQKTRFKLLDNLGSQPAYRYTSPR